MVDIKLWCIVISAIVIKKVVTDSEVSLTDNTLHAMHGMHGDSDTPVERMVPSNYSNHENELPTIEKTTTSNPSTPKWIEAREFITRRSRFGRRRMFLPTLPSYVRTTELSIVNESSHTYLHMHSGHVDRHRDRDHLVTTIASSSQTAIPEEKDLVTNYDCLESRSCVNSTLPQRKDQSKTTTKTEDSSISSNDDIRKDSRSNSGNSNLVCFSTTNAMVMTTLIFRILSKNV